MSRGKPWRVVALGAVCVGLVMSAPGVAVADPTSPPSTDDIQKAKQDEDLTAASITQLESMLTSLGKQRDAANVTAGIAAEKYNKAVVELDAAKSKAATAQTALNKAADDRHTANAQLARVAMQANQTGGPLAELEPLLSANGPEDAMAMAEALDMVGTASSRALEKSEVAEQSWKAASYRRDQAVAAQKTATKQLQDAKDQAEAAAATAQKDFTAADQRRSALITELAVKKQTTAKLETERQDAIEAQQQAAANEKARQERIAAENADRNSNTGAGSSGGTGSGGSGGGDSGSSTPAVNPPPAVGPSASAGERAVAWAKTKLGLPYIWGGTGPSGYDCSGLTQQAWLHGGGVQIPRVAADQYYASTKIPYSQMRPGDLIFYSSGGYIYHVTMYIGGGQMIEAPHTGAVVRIGPVRYSESMPYAGRP